MNVQARRKQMALSVWRIGLAPLFLSVLILSGCGGAQLPDCVSISEDQRNAVPPFQRSAMTDSMESVLQVVCSDLAALRDTLAAVPAAPDTTLAKRIEVLLDRQVRMDSLLHATFITWMSTISGELSPQDTASLSRNLGTGFTYDSSASYLTRLLALSDHVTRFGEASVPLREQIATGRAGYAGRLLGLHISLMDSLDGLLRVTVQRGATTTPRQLTLGLDSLFNRLALLDAAHTVLVEMHAAFLDTTGGGILPVDLTAESVRTREFIWQIRQETDILPELVSLLAALSEYAIGGQNHLSGLRMEQTLARLRDLVDALMAKSSILADLHSSRSSNDSLRLTANEMRNELLRQGYILAELQKDFALLADRGQPAILLLERTAGLYLGVHGELEALTEVLLAEMGSELASYGTKVALIVLLLALCLLVIRSMNWLLNLLAERYASRRLLYKRLIPVMRLAAWSIAIYVALAYILQLDQRSLLAAGAAIGVAIGFAAQDIVKNVFGGIIIIFGQTFQVGDKIRVGGTYGEVIAIGLRATRIVTLDDNEVTVPNAHVIDSQVANANTGSLTCQVVVDLYVPGWTEVTQAKSIAYSAAANSKYVHMGKPIVVHVQDTFKETFLTKLSVKAYVLDTRHEAAFASEVTETAKAEFADARIFRLPKLRP
ncbi:MAG: mechanosensitive ion channel [Bacteroidota bacterium]|nr:mechanosensitive ion channel [Bacteroidota bacterium]